MLAECASALVFYPVVGVRLRYMRGNYSKNNMKIRQIRSPWILNFLTGGEHLPGGGVSLSSKVLFL